MQGGDTIPIISIGWTIIRNSIGWYRVGWHLLDRDSTSVHHARGIPEQQASAIFTHLALSPLSHKWSINQNLCKHTEPWTLAASQVSAFHTNVSGLSVRHMSFD